MFTLDLAQEKTYQILFALFCICQTIVLLCQTYTHTRMAIDYHGQVHCYRNNYYTIHNFNFRPYDAYQIFFAGNLHRAIFILLFFHRTGKHMFGLRCSTTIINVSINVHCPRSETVCETHSSIMHKKLLTMHKKSLICFGIFMKHINFYIYEAKHLYSCFSQNMKTYVWLAIFNASHTPNIINILRLRKNSRKFFLDRGIIMVLDDAIMLIVSD